MRGFGVLLVLVVAIVVAGSAGARTSEGGALTILTLDPINVDPAHGTDSQIDLQINYAVGLNLVSFPDKPAPAGSMLQPDAAAGMPTVSTNGKQYTFKIRKGLRFSDGKPVMAANFRLAFQRSVGVQPAARRMMSNVSGIVAKGHTFVVKLKKRDGGLLAKLGMPFFSALALNQTVLPFSSAGPYYIKSRTPNGSIVLAKNKYYKGSRPHNADTITITQTSDEAGAIQQVENGQVDAASGLTLASADSLAAKYGVNSGRFFVHPIVETDYVALNTSRPIFGSLQMRKAANFAIDRPAMLRVRGAFAGKRTDQILPPGMGGFKDAKLYPIQGADYQKAKQLAGNKCGTVNLYTTNSPIGQGFANEFKFNLTQIGCIVNVKSFTTPAAYFGALETRGEPFDAAFLGASAPYPDPYDYLNVLLNGKTIGTADNQNFSYFNDPSYNRKLDQAARSVGSARYNGAGKLAVDVMTNAAPFVPFDNVCVRDFVSSHVSNVIFQPVSGGLDLGAVQIR